MLSKNHPHWKLGYCTNIHPGTTVSEICDNLENVSFQVCQRSQSAFSSKRPLPVGLWLPAEATRELRRHPMKPLIDSLKKNHLTAYTINGFPYDNFHAPRVKHAVYRPTWWDDERLGYTRDLAKILSELMPEKDNTGTISTLPLGWPRQQPDEQGIAPSQWSDVSEDQLHHAGTNMRRMAEDLRMLEDRTGKRVIVAIEPEPGCLLDNANDVVQWFDKQLPDPGHRRYIGVCHDVCHSAVMMEDQAAVLRQYASAGIVLGKVQISSAIAADWQSLPQAQHTEALAQLSELAEDRYLHQTGRRHANGDFSLAEDLPDLLADLGIKNASEVTDQRWVTHFHVPIFLEKFGRLSTTQSQIMEVLKTIDMLCDESQPSALEFTGHLEVETYAWSVIPESLRQGELAIEADMTPSQAMARDIAHELTWLMQRI